MNFVLTSKSFSVLRTATLTALGVSALFVAPASAGVIYTTNFSSINITGTPGLSKASQLTNAGNYTVDTGFNFGTQTGNGTLAVSNPDVYVYSFAGTGNGISTLPTGDGSGTNLGLLLNSACNPGAGACNSSNVGAVTLTLTGLTANQTDNVSAQFWASTTGGPTGFQAANPNNLSLTIDVGSAALSSSIAGSTSSYAVTSATTGTFETATLNFTPTGTTAVITLLDNELSPANAGNPPAPILGNITVQTVAATPEPSTALFLLIPAALFALYRRRSVRQN